MLGDDVQSKAVKITYKGVTITAKVIGELIKSYLNQEEKQAYGKQSLKKLNRKGRAINSIPVINEDLKGLEKELKKYGVDYSVRKSLSEPDTYDVWFKGSDITQIQTALKNYTSQSFKKSQNRDEKESVMEKVEKAAHKAKERNENQDKKEKTFERGHDDR